MPELDWVNLTALDNKRKRPEHVCGVCHGKKIKCDLQARSNLGHAKCTYCDTNCRDCSVRVPKRGRVRNALARDSIAAEALENIRQDQAQLGQTVQGQAQSNQQHATVETGTSHFTSSFEFQLGCMGEVSPKATSLSFSEAGFRLQSSRPIESTRRATVASQTLAQSTITPPIQQTDSRLPRTDPSPRNRFSAAISSASNEHAETGEVHTGDVDTGFLQVYDLEHSREVSAHVLSKTFLPPQPTYGTSLINPDLQQSFIETYFEYAYPFCPILNRESLADELSRSPLLSMALAVVGSHVNPPLIPHEGPASYYEKARKMFYDDAEPDTLTSLKAVALFYWWAPLSTTVVQRHSSWWWTSVLIRHAQQMNFHREVAPGDPRRTNLDLSLRRRTWWTAFARERLTALCQSKPCIIDPEDCNIAECTLSDFPPDAGSQRNGQIFIYWVRLCGIIGRIAKALSRSAANMKSDAADGMHGGSFLNDLREELMHWVQSLPEDLKLPIKGARTETFDRAIHQLHLPYLCVVTILHLKRSSQSLPQALPPAILAASCTARILRDILSRGNSRFLMAITCWYTGTAFVALLQGRSVRGLTGVEEELDVLESAAKQLQHMWASANVLMEGFRRLRTKEPATIANKTSHGLTGTAHQPHLSRSRHAGVGGTNSAEELDWAPFFPFVTPLTNSIAAQLLSNRANGTATRGFPSPSNEGFHEAIMMQYQDLFDPYFQEFSWWANFPGGNFAMPDVDTNVMGELDFEGGEQYGGAM